MRSSLVQSADANLEVSPFAPGDGILEDPVSGRGNGAALHSFAEGLSYVASQDRCVGRDGLAAVEFEDDTIWLGGNAVTCVEGSLKF